MSLKINLFIFLQLLFISGLSANSLTIETTAGSNILLNNSQFISLDKSETSFVINREDFTGPESVAQITILSDGYRPLVITLSLEKLLATDFIELSLTPLPLIDRWGRHIQLALLILTTAFIGFFLIRKSVSSKRNGNVNPESDSNFDKSINPETDTETDIELDSATEFSEETSTNTFDRYSLISHLATGGISQVYKAKNEKGETVALKIMSNFLNDKDMVGKFIGEGWALKNIKYRFPHSPIVDVYDFGRENEAIDGTPYIAMELVDGTPLSKILGKNSLNYSDKIGIIKQLTEALHATHSTDVLHRDVSPDNVLIRNGKPIQICLIDFGVAKHEVNWLKGTSYGAAYGKPEYMSPEQFSGIDTIDYCSDYYSLGVLIYALFTGKPPYQDSNTYKVGDMHKNDPIPKMPDDVPDNIRALVYKLMSKSPGDRPQSPSEILGYLN